MNYQEMAKKLAKEYDVKCSFKRGMKLMHSHYMRSHVVGGLIMDKKVKATIISPPPKSAEDFAVFLHELGHHQCKHTPSLWISDTLEEEREASLFAIKKMKELGVYTYDAANLLYRAYTSYVRWCPKETIADHCSEVYREFCHPANTEVAQ